MEIFDRDKEGSEVMNGVSQYIESNVSASEVSSSVVANGVPSKSEENVIAPIRNVQIVERNYSLMGNARYSFHSI